MKNLTGPRWNLTSYQKTTAIASAALVFLVIQLGKKEQAIATKDKQITALLQQRGQPLPASELPDGLYTSTGLVVFTSTEVDGKHATRCYWTLESEKEKSIWLNKDGVRIIKDFETREKQWNEPNSINEDQFDAIDQRAVRVARRLNFDNDLAIIIVSKGKAREYTMDNFVD